MMYRVCHIWRDTRGSAAEFALVLPIFLFLLLGTIDVGRYMWFVAQAEKATQMGTRYAVVTDMVPTGLYSYNFASASGVSSGDVVPISTFPGVDCSAPSGTVSCTCASGGSCSFPLTADQDAFDNIVMTMQRFYGGISRENVVIRYDWSGLGYAGNPNGSDVEPIVTIRLTNLNFKPLISGTLGSIGLPGTSHSLTNEDGSGDFGH